MARVQPPKGRLVGGAPLSVGRPPANSRTVPFRDTFQQRAVDQLIEHVVDGVVDEPRVVHEGVPIRFLESADVTHDLDAIRARLDQRHGCVPFAVTRDARDTGGVAGVIARASPP